MHSSIGSRWHEKIFSQVYKLLVVKLLVLDFKLFSLLDHNVHIHIFIYIFQSYVIMFDNKVLW